MEQNARIPQIVFDGSFTCATPVSFVLHNGPKKDRMPMQPTLRTADGERFYLNAPAIRSALRHAATEHVIELMGRRVTLDDYFLMALGGIKDAKSKDAGKDVDKDADKEASQNEEPAVNENDVRGALLKFDYARNHNPLLMLFGSMDVPGALECAHAIATTSATQPRTSGLPARQTASFGGVRANDFRRSPDIADLLDPDAIDAFVERQAQAAQRSGSKKAVSEIEKKIRAAKASGDDAEVQRLNDEKARITDESSAVVQLQQLLSYEAIPQGTSLTQSMRLRRVSDDEIALFVQSIARWGLDPVIGGKRNHGLGRISAHWRVRARLPGDLKFTDWGSIGFDADGDGVVAEGRIADYLDVGPLRRSIAEGKMDFSHKAIASLA